MLNTVSNKVGKKTFSPYGPLKNGAGSQLVSLSVIKIWVSLFAVLNG
jgi:hypothetical protein